MATKGKNLITGLRFRQDLQRLTQIEYNRH